jgi:hypothetical protein
MAPPRPRVTTVAACMNAKTNGLPSSDISERWRSAGVKNVLVETTVWAQWWQRVGERELRSVTMSGWDPIGVADEPLAASEYDNYLAQIVERLRAEVTTDDLAGYLADVRASMGLERDVPRDLAAARRMREWYAASIAGYGERPDQLG